MIEFFPPHARAVLPTFCTNCPDGSHFAQMGSNFAKNTIPNSSSYSAEFQQTHTPCGDMYVHKTLSCSECSKN